MKPVQERYLELIDSALAVPLENRHFAEFVDSTLEFFYGPEKTGTPASDLSLDLNASALLQAGRIERLFEATASRSAQQSEQQSLATLSFSGSRVSGNAAAEAMFACSFPVSARDIIKDPSLLTAIADMAKPGGASSQIILAQLDLALAPVSLAALQKKAQGGAVEVTFSFVDWSRDRIVRIARALGLTPSEGEVLQGHLTGLTRRDIALARGTSEETVKAQSKSILQKTGCKRIADLVPLATSLAFVLDAAPRISGPNEVRLPHGILSETLYRDGRTISFHRYGRGKTAFLFHHGQPIGPFFTRAFLDVLDAADVSIIAPSRPGYGATEPHKKGTDFLETVLEDAVAVLDHCGLDAVAVAGHQIGTAYAVATANRLGNRARAVIALNGGAPIDEAVYADMDRWSRMVATGTRYAPAVLQMAVNLGVGDYRRRSAEAFVLDRYGDEPVDRSALNDPDIMRANCKGVEHLTAQNAVTFVEDQKLKLSDWSERYQGLTCPILWLIPTACKIMPPDHITRFAQSHRAARIALLQDAGSLALYSHATEMAEHIVGFLSDTARR